MAGTFWAVLPPVIAIVLALITKEVYSSLLIGILVGALLFTGFNPLTATEVTFDIMGAKIADNVDILIFLVMLGMLVSLVTKSGASRAYGEWASRVIKSRRGALLATSFLGVFIFMDDYFNCLTVGTVMRPVTDKYKVTRAKLAYIIDSTAAPVCIIAPVS
ncbi:MAG: Na+/H+ antiporter NhaC family protein, partial [Butyricicoccus sp.]